MLESEADLLGASSIKNEGEDNESRHKLMVIIRKERKSHVREDKVLCKEVDELKELLCPPTRLMGKVDVCVI